MEIAFKGKVALVTGAASGISRVIAGRFARDSARVTLMDLNAEWGERAAEEIRAAGGEAWFARADVRDGAQVDRVVAETVERYGRVDILVHGAGVGVHKEVIDLSDDEWDLQIDVQLRGAFLLARAVGRRLVAQGEGGRIIFIGSTSGNNARPNAAPHAASKAGEIQLMRVLTLEMGKHGVTANVVSPGLTDISGISTSSQNPEYQKRFITQVPLGRLARPDEIADAVLFVASDKAAFLSGQMICVDGGYSAGKLAVQGPHVDAYYGINR